MHPLRERPFDRRAEKARDGRQLHGSQTARPSVEASLLPLPQLQNRSSCIGNVALAQPGRWQLVGRALMGTGTALRWWLTGPDQEFNQIYTSRLFQATYR